MVEEYIKGVASALLFNLYDEAMKREAMAMDRGVKVGAT